MKRLASYNVELFCVNERVNSYRHVFVKEGTDTTQDFRAFDVNEEEYIIINGKEYKCFMT